eukprot:TRINITY_DN2157_c0_g1_i2.p1 TRINITY_DN2157_c0_g1~~TRINITY_DN2157_c0_g1_i2.p1  ORF type:complete len:551 (-),score=86.02 TRINITY_DN2157_c0_g1_i2:382-2034(-)
MIEQIIEILIAIIVAAYVIYTYSDHKRITIDVYISTFLMFFAAFAIVILIPLDIMYVEEDKKASDTILLCWWIIYWFQFCMVWFIVPFQQDFANAPDFSKGARALTSLRINALFYMILLLISVAAILLVLYLGFLSSQNIIGVVMALSNVWALFLIIITLSYGLIDIPRRLWRRSECKIAQKKLEMKCMPRHEKMLDAAAELEALKPEAYEFFERAMCTHRFEEPLKQMRSKLTDFSFPDSSAISENRRKMSLKAKRDAYHDITLEKLVELNSKCISSILKARKAETEWNKLVKRWMKLEALQEEDFGVACTLGNVKGKKKILLFKFQRKYQKYLLKGLSIICILLSTIVVFSELTMFLPWDVQPLRYLYMRLDSRIMALFLIYGPFLIYMALCSYYPLLRLKIFDFYNITKGNTDPSSMLYLGSYFLRLIVPLTWNFTAIITGPESKDTLTAFQLVMGIMDVTPALGQRINAYFPLAMLLVLILVYSEAVQRCLSRMNLGNLLWSEIDVDDDSSEGLRYLQQLKIEKELASSFKTKASTDDAELLRDYL